MGRGNSTPQDEENKKIIAAKINQLLLAQNKKKIELHRATGIPVSTITGYVQAKTLPNPENLEKISTFFEVKKSAIDPRFSKDEIKVNVNLDEILARSVAWQGKDLSESDKAIIKAQIQAYLDHKAK
ncbi:MAG: helix-turn-helix transcriptional regulator [Streptococcaceae bacterium]|jgi:transcriptional regulator with XRE-family HTH domain|nr:helix-turn-helix transcriptional regulator [Streptococcaceae bacterium]